ncbi:hypothetical protein HPP92_010297 [Vanilla planifolia]|uniref:Uncharacterized protein n=1 Tax=Vanilla planifolia TaxID=51239 RepID=A0A835V2C5_VANPL|nr:hypothetical protein HPP92_010297 [Vanilla planifolia]
MLAARLFGFETDGEEHHHPRQHQRRPECHHRTVQNTEEEGRSAFSEAIKLCLLNYLTADSCSSVFLESGIPRTKLLATSHAREKRTLLLTSEILPENFPVEFEILKLDVF